MKEKQLHEKTISEILNKGSCCADYGENPCIDQQGLKQWTIAKCNHWLDEDMKKICMHIPFEVKKHKKNDKILRDSLMETNDKVALFMKEFELTEEDLND